MRKYFLGFLIISVLASCAPPRKSFELELWELESTATKPLSPRPNIVFYLPWPIQDSNRALAKTVAPRLANLSITQWLQNAKSYNNGLLGEIDGAVVYISAKTRPPKENYWMIVRVLSEKYGCFMTTKASGGRITFFRCRDGRRVAFWTLGRGTFQAIYARQFDAEGYEIIVRQRKIFRTGRRFWQSGVDMTR